MTISDNWKEFYEHYRFLAFDRKGLGIDVFIPNDMFKTINSYKTTGKLKAFMFAAFVLLKVTNSKGYYLSNPEIKNILGYSKKNRLMDIALQENGIMDTEGLTETIEIELDPITNTKSIVTANTKVLKRKVIKHKFDVKKGNFFKIPCIVFLGCMGEAGELGIIAFYIYSFVCLSQQVQSRGSKTWPSLSISYISTGIGLSESTVKKYINHLEKFGLLEVERGNKFDKFGYHKGINKYAPVRKLTPQYYDKTVRTEALKHKKEKEPPKKIEIRSDPEFLKELTSFPGFLKE